MSAVANIRFVESNLLTFLTIIRELATILPGQRSPAVNCMKRVGKRLALSLSKLTTVCYR